MTSLMTIAGKDESDHDIILLKVLERTSQFNINSIVHNAPVSPKMLKVFSHSKDHLFVVDYYSQFPEVARITGKLRQLLHKN